MRGMRTFRVVVYPIILLFIFLLASYTISLVIVFKSRQSIENEYNVLQENLLEKVYILNKVITACNHIISYDSGDKEWAEVKKDLWDFNSPVMGYGVIESKISDNVLANILKDDPLNIKERRDNTLIEYEATLKEVYLSATLLRKSKSSIERKRLFQEYQHKVQVLLGILNQHNDELMQIQSVYFSYLKDSLLKTMSHLSRMIYSLIVFAVLIAILIIAFFNERRRSEIALLNANLNLKNIYNASIPIRVVGKDFTITQTNDAYDLHFNLLKEEVIGRKCHKVFPRPECDQDDCPVRLITAGADEVVHEIQKTKDGIADRYFIVTARPFRNGKGEVIGIVESYQDITERRQAEAEQERLIAELKQALKEVRTLQGFLPICSSCKKVRDDEGYWQQIETYIAENSEATFSHSICPQCAKKLYPDMVFHKNKGS
jgi:PAS domain S-box-containing protein